MIPDVPTSEEQGLPQFQAAGWRPSRALSRPKGTPADIVEKLDAAAKAALRDETVRKRLLELGAELSRRGRPDAGRRWASWYAPRSEVGAGDQEGGRDGELIRP